MKFVLDFVLNDEVIRFFGVFFVFVNVAGNMPAR